MLIKRILDFIISLVALIILSPLMLIIYILVKINLGSPAFFVQERVGKDNKVFKMIKFRTMRDARDKNGNLLSDNERVTKLGSFLRSFSLDELPELINILKGDMSLVGPRALLVQYLGLYNDEQIRRHEVLPGLTGWAQINGRDELPIPYKAQLDGEYVDKMSFLFDWKMSKNNLEKKLLSSEFSDEEKFEIKEKILNEDNLRTVNYTKKLSFIINDIDNLKKNFKKNSYIIIAITLICAILMWVIYFCTK